MSAPDVIEIGPLAFRHVAHPSYAEAHPGESCGPDETCERCVIAERIGTGERVLLWLCGGINWSISRHDPNHERLVAEIHSADLVSL